MSMGVPGTRKSTLKSWATSLSIFAGFGSSLFFCLTLETKEAVSQRFSNTVDALELQRGYQGLMLDTAGVGGMLSSLIETDGRATVLALRIETSQKVLLQRSFSAPSASTLHLWVGEFGFECVVNGSRYSGRGLLSKSVLFENTLLSFLLSAMISLLEAMFRTWRKRRAELALTERINQLALQVAHDIRAPLGTILAIQSELSQLPEETRQLLELATTRIQRIASNLLNWKTERAHPAQCPPSLASAERVDLAQASTSMLMEKRAQYQNTPNVQLHLRLARGSPRIFARVELVEFQRVLSNLIDNAVQAMPREGGEVQVSLERNHAWTRVRVADNGLGIPAEWIPKLGVPGATFGKSTGSGLGLSHARSWTETWGGTLRIESTLGQGTTVSIQLPSAQSV